MECTVCKEKFGGERAFDIHRKGTYTQESFNQNSRYCLTPRQMVQRGMGQNSRGAWITRERSGEYATNQPVLGGITHS